MARIQPGPFKQANFFIRISSNPIIREELRVSDNEVFLVGTTHREESWQTD